MDLGRRLRRAGFELRVDHRLRVDTSGRRFEAAFCHSVFVYARNWLHITLTGRPHPQPIAWRRPELSVIE